MSPVIRHGPSTTRRHNPPSATQHSQETQNANAGRYSRSQHVSAQSLTSTLEGEIEKQGEKWEGKDRQFIEFY